MDNIHYEILDDFLPEEDFLAIKTYMFHPEFSWNLTTTVSKRGEELPIVSSYYFTHMFWSKFNVQKDSQIFSPILNEVNCRAIIRIKGNLYPSTEKIIHHENHVDYDFSHKGAIFYLNTNDGLTILENNVAVESIENRLLLFDPSKIHRSTTCTNSICRANINFNFF